MNNCCFSVIPTNRCTSHPVSYEKGLKKSLNLIVEGSSPCISLQKTNLSSKQISSGFANIILFICFYKKFETSGDIIPEAGKWKIRFYFLPVMIILYKGNTSLSLFNSHRSIERKHIRLTD